MSMNFLKKYWILLVYPFCLYIFLRKMTPDVSWASKGIYIALSFYVIYRLIIKMIAFYKEYIVNRLKK